jgi:hypothetical protein
MGNAAAGTGTFFGFPSGVYECHGEGSVRVQEELLRARVGAERLNELMKNVDHGGAKGFWRSDDA